MSTTDHERAHASYTPVEAQYLAMQESAEFQQLRRRYRGWVLPVTAGALVWYALYVFLAAYAPGFMANKLVGNINVGLVLGLLQFVATFGVTAAYVRHADNVLDPAAESLRRSFDGTTGR